MALLTVAVVWPRVSQCQDGQEVQVSATATSGVLSVPDSVSGGGSGVTSGSGFLASTVTDATGCGAAETPWVVKAHPGQRLNITLHDFSAVMLAINASRAPSQPQQHCHVLAIIKVRGSIVTEMKTP